MDLGAGEYLIIEACMLGQYNAKAIISLIRKLEAYNMRVFESSYYKIEPEEITLEAVMDGNLEIEQRVDLLIKDLTSKPLIDADIILDEKIQSRILINFWDRSSFTVALIFNYSDLEEGNRINETAQFLETIAISFFEALKPLFGLVAVEKSAMGICNLKENHDFPTDRAFYNEFLFDKGKSEFEKLLQNAKCIFHIEGCGYYFRRSEIYDFAVRYDEDEQKELHRVLHPYL